MAFDTLKLEKGMYTTGKSFTALTSPWGVK